MVEKIKVTKDQEAADEIYETGLSSTDKKLIFKCLDSDSQVPESSYIIYDRIDARERDLVYKEALDEREEILRLRDEGLKNMLKWTEKIQQWPRSDGGLYIRNWKNDIPCVTVSLIVNM